MKADVITSICKGDIISNDYPDHYSQDDVSVAVQCFL